MPANGTYDKGQNLPSIGRHTAADLPSADSWTESQIHVVRQIIILDLLQKVCSFYDPSPNMFAQKYAEYVQFGILSAHWISMYAPLVKSADSTTAPTAPMAAAALIAAFEDVTQNKLPQHLNLVNTTFTQPDYEYHLRHSPYIGFRVHSPPRGPLDKVSSPRDKKIHFFQDDDINVSSPPLDSLLSIDSNNNNNNNNNCMDKHGGKGMNANTTRVVNDGGSRLPPALSFEHLQQTFTPAPVAQCATASPLPPFKMPRFSPLTPELAPRNDTPLSVGESPLGTPSENEPLGKQTITSKNNNGEDVLPGRPSMSKLSNNEEASFKGEEEEEEEEEEQIQKLRCNSLALSSTLPTKNDSQSFTDTVTDNTFTGTYTGAPRWSSEDDLDVLLGELEEGVLLKNRSESSSAQDSMSPQDTPMPNANGVLSYSFGRRQRRSRTSPTACMSAMSAGTDFEDADVSSVGTPASTRFGRCFTEECRSVNENENGNELVHAVGPVVFSQENDVKAAKNGKKHEEWMLPPSVKAEHVKMNDDDDDDGTALTPHDDNDEHKMHVIKNNIGPINGMNGVTTKTGEGNKGGKGHVSHPSVEQMAIQKCNPVVAPTTHSLVKSLSWRGFGPASSRGPETGGWKLRENEALLRPIQADTRAQQLRRLATFSPLPSTTIGMNNEGEDLQHEALARPSISVKSSLSIFDRDFIYGKKLGEGSFGQVFEVSHKLDGKRYAVKAVNIETDDNELKEKTIREVQSWAQVADHPHICQYFHAWMEAGWSLQDNQIVNHARWVDSEESHKSDSVSGLDLSRAVFSRRHMEIGSSNNSTSHGIWNYTADSNDMVVFEDSQPTGKGFDVVPTKDNGASEHMVPTKLGSRGFPRAVLSNTAAAAHNNNVNQHLFSTHNTHKKKQPQLHHGGNRHHRKEDFLFPQTLFIQMELCDSTLTQYINAQSRGLHQSISAQELLCGAQEYDARTTQTPPLDDAFRVRATEALTIFGQLLSALAHIHAHGLVHRDVKPSNIYRASSNRWVLGDFGLCKARKEVFAKTYDDCNGQRQEEEEKEERAQHLISSSPNTDESEGKEQQRGGVYQQQQQKKIKNNGEEAQEKMVALAAGVAAGSGLVGTIAYSSPEQLLGDDAHVGEKADMYAVGLVLLELLMCFPTHHERAATFRDVRGGLNSIKGRRRVPQSLVEKLPRVAELILCLCDPDPEKRPSAQNLLDENSEWRRKIMSDLRKMCGKCNVSSTPDVWCLSSYPFCRPYSPSIVPHEDPTIDAANEQWRQTSMCTTAEKGVQTTWSP